MSHTWTAFACSGLAKLSRRCPAFKQNGLLAETRLWSSDTKDTLLSPFLPCSDYLASFQWSQFLLSFVTGASRRWSL